MSITIPTGAFTDDDLDGPVTSFSGGFHYANGGFNRYTAITASDGAPMFGVEFALGNGWLDDFRGDLVGAFAYEVVQDGSSVGSGFLDVTLGTIAAEVRTGADAVGTWEDDAPGVRRHITPADLPPPTHAENDPEAPDFERMAMVVEAPQGKMPDVPEGFAVQVFASGLNEPRVIRIAPNGDIFVAESGAGRVLVFAADSAGGASAMPEVFAGGLDRPFGIAFYPPAEPRYVYVGAANQVVRFPYRAGDRSRSPASSPSCCTGSGAAARPSGGATRRWRPKQNGTLDRSQRKHVPAGTKARAIPSLKVRPMRTLAPHIGKLGPLTPRCGGSPRPRREP